MAGTKQISMRWAGLLIRPWSRFLQLRASGRCQLAAAWQQRPAVTTPVAQPD